MKEYPSEYSRVQGIIPDSFDKSGGVWLLRIGCNIAKPNYQAGPRQIPNYSVHLVKKGCARFVYGDKEIILSKGSMFFHYPHTIHRYGIVSEEIPLELAWVKFDGVQVPKLLSMLGVTKESPFLIREPDETVTSLFGQMLDLAEL